MNQIIDNIKLLRFPFSVFLLPITLMSLVFIQPVFGVNLILVVVIWHVLVYPSSNGYNSYHDQDTGPIGALENPPPATRSLLTISNCMDITAIGLSFLINWKFALLVGLYILSSRAYSNRKVRLKKYPVIGFLVVFVFQGIWIFCSNVVGLSSMELFNSKGIIPYALASSFFIATIYPLTQIYQHEADKKDNVKTLSMLLGIKGTFLLSGFMFFCASTLLFISNYQVHKIYQFWLFLVVLAPSTLYFLFWMIKSLKDLREVNFKNTMKMLILSSILTNLYFIIILINP
jgi:1,4-dihydroxy-2-naphthoate octaprenyltransferase